MSQENVEIVRRAMEAQGRGELQGGGPQSALETWAAECADPDIDYYPVRKWPESRPCHGREEFSHFLFNQHQQWSRWDYEIQKLTAVGDDRVLVHVRLLAEGRESALRLEGDVYQCFWLRHGQFFRLEDHLTLKGALHAFGFAGDTLEDVGPSE